MLWLDITDPKYALFFSAFLPRLLELDSILITTRESPNYTECAQILSKVESSYAKARLQVCSVGGYGGADKLGKYRARVQREQEFLSLFSKIGELPRVFMSGASVEGAQCAFGLGIPIVHFADTPIAGHAYDPKDITALARLSLPLSSVLFHPFVIPQSVFSGFGLESSNVYSYDFIDIALWLDSSSLLSSSNLPSFITQSLLPNAAPLIIAREEEYKAHYVKAQYRLWYESVHRLAQERVRLLIIPRYGKAQLEAEFGAYSNVQIAQEIIAPHDLYAQASLLLGGGGTMNLESCFLGIPTISTRSLLLYHDCYLLEHKLMHHAKSVEEVMNAFYAYRDSGFARKESKALFIKPQSTAHTLKDSLPKSPESTLKDALESSLHSIVQIIATRFY